MKTIPLTRGKSAIVDSADFERLSKWKWCASSEGYAIRRSGRDENGRQRTILMHREILQTPESLQGDHVNGDTLDNRRFNLRNCEHAQNACNRKKPQNNSTGFKGVSRSRGKFRAAIRVGGKDIFLGRFPTPSAAHAAYCEAAKIHHGEFARVS